MAFQETKYYADPDFLLMIDALETQHGEYKPVEVGYAYKIGRGKSQTINSKLHQTDEARQLLYEADELEFWPYPGSLPKHTTKPTPNYNFDPDFLLTVHAWDQEQSIYIPVEVGRGYKIGRGKKQMIKAGLEQGIQEKELVMGAAKLELRPFVRIIPESLGEPTPEHQPNYRLEAALSR